MKKDMNRKELLQESIAKTRTRQVRWGAIGTGIWVGVLFIIGISYMPLSTIVLGAGVCVVIVIAALWKGLDGVLFVRWWARTVGVVMGLLLATIFIGDTLGGHGPPLSTLGEIASFIPWLVLFVGLIVAFFWEGIGGAIIALAALVEQGNVLVEAHGELNPFIVVFVFVGLAFVSCWWRLRHLS